MGNFRDNRIAREEQMAQLRANANQGLLEDFAEIGALIGPSPQQIRRQTEQRGLISPNPFLTTGQPTDFNQVNALDSALLSQGMPPISSPSPFVTDAARDTTAAEDIGLVSPEEFIQDATQFGEPETAFPVVERTQEEKDETKSRFSDLGDIFDNKKALGKIALGIALLEGTPIDEAFELYNSFGQEVGEAEVELFNRQTGQIEDVGAANDPEILAKFRANPNIYSIDPIGSLSARLSDREDLIFAENIERDSKDYNENFAKPAAQAKSALADAKKLKEIITDPNFKSGALQEQSLDFRRILSEFGIADKEIVNQQLAFRTIVSKLIPNVRPAGAGATSDFEIDLYKQATVALNNPEEVNLRLVNDMISFNNLVIKRAEYTDKVLRAGGSLRQADSDFGLATDLLYSPDYNPQNLNAETTELLEDIYGFVPIPASKVAGFRDFFESEAENNSKVNYGIVDYL